MSRAYKAGLFYMLLLFFLHVIVLFLLRRIHIYVIFNKDLCKFLFKLLHKETMRAFGHIYIE